MVMFALAMWGPGLAAILVTRFVAQQPFSSLRLGAPGPKRYYLLAWLFSPLILFALRQFDWNESLPRPAPGLTKL